MPCTDPEKDLEWRRNAYAADADKYKERSRTWYRNNAGRQRDANLQKRYGITLAEYDLLLEKQGGVCAICRHSCSSGHNLCVDHDHETLAVRGLLCKSCSVGIGRLKDDVMLLQSAILYLKDYQ